MLRVVKVARFLFGQRQENPYIVTIVSERMIRIRAQADLPIVRVVQIQIVNITGLKIGAQVQVCLKLMQN